MARRRRAKVLFLDKSTGCMFCKRSIDDELEFGGLRKTKNFRAHYYCLLFSETIAQTGTDSQGIYGFLPKDMLNELSKSAKRQCYYCKEFGATLGCSRKHCNRKFHLPCGLMKNTGHNFNNFSSFCHAHRKPCNVPTRIKQSITEYLCMICFQNFTKDSDMTQVIWADCCKADILFHKTCMKQMALSAGYFTKCPGCNNRIDFIKTIKQYGVFVPERDASWELCENAFSELLYVHKRCDIAECVCPDGREHVTEVGKWKIILCNLCGSYGAHAYCLKGQKKLKCNLCDFKSAESQNTGNQNRTIQLSKKTVSTVTNDTDNLTCSGNWSTSVEELTAPCTSNTPKMQNDSIFKSYSSGETSSDNVSVVIQQDINSAENVIIDLCSDDESEYNVSTDRVNEENLKVLHIPKLIAEKQIKHEEILEDTVPFINIDKKPRQVAVKSTTQVSIKKRKHTFIIEKSEVQDEELPAAKRVVSDTTLAQNNMNEINITYSDQHFNTNVIDDSAPIFETSGNRCSLRFNRLIKDVRSSYNGNEFISDNDVEETQVPKEEEACQFNRLVSDAIAIDETDNWITSKLVNNQVWVETDSKIGCISQTPQKEDLSAPHMQYQTEKDLEVVVLDDDNDGDKTDWSSKINITNIRTLDDDEISLLDAEGNVSDAY